MVQPPPGTISGPGIRARVGDYRRYDKILRREILNPIMRDAEERIRNAGQSYLSIRIAIQQIPDAASVQPLAEAAATAQMTRLRNYHTQKFTRLMSRYFGANVGPLIGDFGVENIMRDAIQDNVNLIRTISPRFHAQLTQEMLQLATDVPFDEREISRLLRKTYKMSGYNVRRIARDQTSKTIAKFNSARQRQIGVTEYIWRTVADERVRKTHVDNNGLMFSWSSPPPITGHPGDDIQCRCRADPVFPRRRL